MDKPWLGLAMIVRNSSATIKTLLDSITGVFDEIVLVDTGSTDDTKHIVEKHFGLNGGDWSGAYVGLHGVARGVERLVLRNFEWVDDFSAARQFSYDLCTSKWICYLDCDDDASCFKDRLRPTLERTDKNFQNVNCISIGYRYTTDGGMVQDKLGRIIKNDGGWAWNDPIHENLQRKPGRGARDISKITDLVVLHQHAGQEKVNNSALRNIRITEKWYANSETTPAKRALAAYYLGMYACEVKQHDLARKYFREAIDGLGRTNLANESLCRWSKMEARLGDHEKSIALASEAISKAPELPDGLSALGVALQLAGEEQRAASVFDMLRAQPKPVMETTHDAIWLDGLVNVHMAQAYYRCGRVDDAVKALDRIPKELINHSEIHAAGQEIHSSLQKTEGYKRLHALWEYLIWDTEPLKAKRLLEELCPAAISDSVQVKQLLQSMDKKLPHMTDWAGYQRTYAAIPDLPYHVPENHREWTLQQGRARLVAQWAASQPKEGRPIEVLAIGIQDAIIEGQMMENCPRIHILAVDVAPQASKGIQELAARFPGRVKGYQLKADHYDWFHAGWIGQFDAVILFEVLEHFPEGGDEAALMKIRSALKVGGKLFLSTPIAAQWVEPYLSDMSSDRPWWHVRAHNPSSLWNLFQEYGFTGSLIGLGKEGLFLASMTKLETPTFAKNEVSIYCYPLGAHGFDPFSAKEGHCGGSEEACIHLSAALARKGYRVTVFTDSPKRADKVYVHEGVMWRSHSEFAPEVLNGTLLVWRAPALAANFKRQNPKLRVLNWLHDTHYEASPEAYERADGTIVLSQFHAEAVRQLDGYQPTLFASNGIVPEEFPEPDESKRDPHSAIYASAPNRGLEFLLDCWPLIRAAVPDATLKVYYSWKLTEQMLTKRHDPVMAALLPKLRAKFEELKDFGVTYVGGVPHAQLNEAYRTSGVWAYPVGASGFNEISCISALRAQASGCWPVIIPLGAMDETCKFGMVVGPPIADVELLTAVYVKAVAKSMLTPPPQEKRTEMREWALQQNWDKSADQFIEAFKAKSERITIYAGAFIRPFGPAGSKDGRPLGGSEQAVIEMAKALAAAGKEVVVYAPRGEPGGRLKKMVEAKRTDELNGELVDDGAKWIDSSKFNPAGPHGTLLAWRCPALLPKLKGNSYPVILWLMDPHYRAGAYDYAEADDVVFLTNAHKDIIRREDGFDGGGSVVHVGLPELPELGAVKRDPKSVMWATSPDRGLLEFLRDTWPAVLKQVPDAKLHIFYGLEPLELNGKARLANDIRDEISKFPFVTYHGGVPDAELYDWYQYCGVFVAPSVGFEETLSISTLKAMALGCWPVVADKGALPEVVDACCGYGQAVPETRFTGLLIGSLESPPSDETREKMAARTREYFSVESMVEKMLKVVEGVQ